MEANLHNYYPSLAFRFKHYLEPFESAIILFYGLATLIAGGCLFLFDDKERRIFYVQILFALQMFDAFVLH